MPALREGLVTGNLRGARLRAQILSLILDVIVLAGAFLCAAALRHSGSAVWTKAWDHAAIFIPLYFLVALYHGVYSYESFRSTRIGLMRILQSFLIALSLGLFASFAAKTTFAISRITLVTAILVGLVLVVSLRVTIVETLRRRFHKGLENSLIIYDGGPTIDLVGSYQVAAGDFAIEPRPDNPDMLDRLGRLAKDMDRLIVSCSSEDRKNWVHMLRGLDVRGEVVSHGIHELGVFGLHREQGFTSLVVATGSLGLKDRALKRALDLAITLPAVIILSPVFIAVALAIWLEDRGPVLFLQNRVGRSNCQFNIMKFRSMRVAGLDQAGDRSASRDDDRVTRVGKFIRRTSLDELPQLFNVIQGDMSLVGPRPHALGSRAGGKLFWEIDPSYWHRHALKPGLTGLAQVRGLRGATDVEEDLTERLKADLEYLQDWTPWTDIIILAQTARVLIHDRAF